MTTHDELTLVYAQRFVIGTVYMYSRKEREPIIQINNLHKNDENLREKSTTNLVTNCQITSPPLWQTDNSHI